MLPTKEFLGHLSLLLNDIGGDWLVAGGALVRLEFDETRSTHDIDFAFIRHDRLSKTEALNELYRRLIAQSSGPDEMNNAFEPFLAEVPNWQTEIVLLREGKIGRLFRPTVTLFTYLKMRRGTEVDCGDVDAARKSLPLEFEETRFLNWVTHSPQSGSIRRNWEAYKKKRSLA